jgi:MoxR-like ATPase
VRAQNLALACKARAAMHGRHLVLGEDLQAVMLPVLRHRLVLNFHAEAEGVRADDLIQRVWKHLEKKRTRDQWPWHHRRSF